jgi:hypothetical protein
LIPRCRRRICFTTTACAEAMDSKYKISVYGFGFAGSADYSELQKALGDYLPLLLGLTFTDEKVSSAVKFEWSNQEDKKKVKTQNTKMSSCSLLVSCTHT